MERDALEAAYAEIADQLQLAGVRGPRASQGTLEAVRAAMLASVEEAKLVHARAWLFDADEMYAALAARIRALGQEQP